jgi:hypothetical protein
MKIKTTNRSDTNIYIQMGDTMKTLTVVKLEIQFDDERATVRLRHPVYRMTRIVDAIPSVRKRANFAFAGWVRATVTSGRKSIVIRP